MWHWTTWHQNADDKNNEVSVIVCVMEFVQMLRKSDPVQLMTDRDANKHMQAVCMNGQGRFPVHTTATV